LVKKKKKNKKKKRMKRKKKIFNSFFYGLSHPIKNNKNELVSSTTDEKLKA